MLILKERNKKYAAKRRDRKTKNSCNTRKKIKEALNIMFWLIGSSTQVATRDCRAKFKSNRNPFASV